MKIKKNCTDSLLDIALSAIFLQATEGARNLHFVLEELE